MTINIKSFTTKDPTTIRDDILRTISNGLKARGITNPAIGPGTDHFLWATALANELAVVNANVTVKADAQMGDTAQGDDLARVVAPFGLSYRPAAGSHGSVIFDSSQSASVILGSQLVDSTGLRYQVSVGAVYANGDSIPVTAIDVGKATNHDVNDVLRWSSAPPYSAQTAIVATGGLTGGCDVEDQETLRARWTSRMQNPPGGGNWQQITIFGEESSPVVQKTFVYPAVNGPSTVHVAVAGYASSASKTRDIDAATMTSTVVPYIQGQLPEYVESVVTTVVNVATDISIGLTLPSAPTAQPAGPGGGWLDGTPWPYVSGLQNYANITSVASSTVFTLNAPTPPQAGVSRIAYLDGTTWTLYTATVVSYTGTAGAYVVTIDTPWPTLSAAQGLGGTGVLVFPQAVNTSIYVDAFLAAMALMGPGEKTANTTILSRGYRHPLPSNSWPSSLNATLLRALSNAGQEVLDVNWNYRSTTTPSLPGLISDPPRILIPRHVAFYAI